MENKIKTAYLGMIVIREQNKNEWESCNKADFLSSVRSYGIKGKFTLFHVGPDRVLINQGRLLASSALISSGHYLFADKNGVITGFIASAVDNRVDRYQNSALTIVFNFCVGNEEFKLTIS